MIARILGVTAIAWSVAAPAFADNASPRSDSDPPGTLLAQAATSGTPAFDPRAEQLAGRPQRERAPYTPRISLDVSGGFDALWLPKVAPAFDIQRDGIGDTPHRVNAAGLDLKLNIPSPFVFLPGSRDSHFELETGLIRGNRTATTELPGFVDIFALNGSSSLLFGGSSASISSQLSFSQNRGDLLLASKYDPCGVPVKVEMGFGYERDEQDHNFASLSQNLLSSAFRMNDHVDTDNYSAIFGATAYKRLGGGFGVSAGFDVRLGVAHSSLSATQMLNNLDFSGSASRTAFGAEVGAKLGVSYRVTSYFQLGIDASYRYKSEIGRAVYPSMLGSELRLAGDSAQSARLQFKGRASF
jgi:hypothetical protein